MDRAALVGALVGAVLVGLAGAAHADDRFGETFRPYAAALLDRVLIGAEALAKRIEAGDLAGARQAWIDARVGWERSETFLVEFFPQIEAAIDAWPNASTGFHAVEPLLFEYGDLQAADDLARQLVRDAAKLQSRFAAVELHGQGLINGLIRLAHRIGAVKAAAGGESPFAGTSLSDLQNNLRGMEALYALSFAAGVRQRSPALHTRLVMCLIEFDAALRGPSIEQVERDEVIAVSRRLSTGFEEAAALLELDIPRLGR